MSFQSLGTPLAVIGLGCRLPAAEGLGQYWDMLLNGRSGVRDVPESRMPLWTRSEKRKGPNGTAYSSVAGLLDDRVADASTLGVGPEEARRWDECHRNLAEIARFAWQDLVAAQQQNRAASPAGGRVGPGLNGVAAGSRSTAASGMGRTGVYVGHSAGGPSGIDRVLAVRALEIADVLRDLPDWQSGGPSAAEAARLPRVIEDFARRIQVGHEYLLPTDEREGDSNGAARFVGRVLGVDGPQLVVDAACASSLVALTMASMALVSGEIDTAVVGGASFFRADGMVLFSQAQSCSARGTRPFDAGADGLIAAEGYVIVILKPLARAIADGDPVHAVISGLGLSSDGRGRSLWAPRKEGQFAAIERAYSPLCRPEDVQLIEAHATSTLVGDATEVTALGEYFRQAAPGQRFPIGSVKSNIGHTLEAAGLVSLLKVILAMKHQVMPATINLEQPSPEIPWNELPFDILTAPRPWPAPAAAGKYRRAAVNAFGIGGLNVHMVVDEGDSANWWHQQLQQHNGQLPTKSASGQATGGLQATVSQPRRRPRHDEPIAIIGRGVVLPGAFDREAFRELLVSRRSALRLADATRWRTPELRQLPGQTLVPAAGEVPFGLVQGYEYDWKRFKIPPKQLRQASPQQFMLLDAALQALNEAGIDGKPLDRSTTAVVMGSSFSNAFSHDLAIGLRIRTLVEQLRSILQTHDLPSAAIPRLLEQFEGRILELYPALLDETGSFTASTLASRINKTFDLMGGAMAIDGQELSGLMALSIAVDLLQSGATSTVLCGAAEGQFDWLSVKHLCDHGRWQPARDHRQTADGRESIEVGGIVGGEGAVILALQRLSDAQAEGRQIFGVIQGIEVQGYGGQSAAKRDLQNRLANPWLSTAPQTAVSWTDCTPRRIELAGPKSQVTSPRLEDQIGYLFGAHALVEIVRQTLVPQPAASSQASQPTTAAAPAAFEVLQFDPAGHLGRVVVTPPGTQQPFLSKRSDSSPVLTAATPATAAVAPAVAQAPASPPITASSANDSHRSMRPTFPTVTPSATIATTALHPPSFALPSGTSMTSSPRDAASFVPSAAPVSGATVAMGGPAPERATAGAWRLVAGSRAELLGLLQRGLAMSSWSELLSAGRNAVSSPATSWQAVIRPLSEEQRLLRLTQWIRRLELQPECGLQDDDIYVWPTANTMGPMTNSSSLGTLAASPARPQVAWLFPGQSGIAPDRIADWAEWSAAARDVLQLADRELLRYSGEDFSGLCRTAAAKDGGAPTATEYRQRLWSSQATVLIADLMVWAAVREAGLTDRMPAGSAVFAGHSYGEIVASVAAGVMDLPTALALTWERTAAIAEAPTADTGLLSINETRETVGEWLSAFPCPLTITHENAPRQTVVGGVVKNLEEFQEFVRREGGRSTLLPVPAAFHSPWLQPAVPMWTRALSGYNLAVPSAALLSSVSNRLVADPEDVRENLSAQLVTPVRYRELIQRLWTLGVRAFVEVGPGQVLTGLNRQILSRHSAICSSAAPTHRSWTDHSGWLMSLLSAVTTRQEAAAATMAASPTASSVTRPTVPVSVPAATLVTPATAAIVPTASTITAAPATPATAVHAAAGPGPAVPSSPVAPLTGNAVAPMASDAPANVGGPQLSDEASLQKFLVDFVVENTGYPSEMIDLDWDMEADLGIDSIKKAQLLGELRELFDLSRLQGGSLKDLRSLRDILNLLREHGRGKREWLNGDNPAAAATASPSTASLTAPAPTVAPAPSQPSASAHESPAAIHPAISAAALAGIERIQPIAPPTGAVAATSGPAPTTLKSSAPAAPAAVAAAGTVSPAQRLREVEQFCRDFVIDRTGYPPELVDSDADLEADLGVDSIAKAQMLGELRDQFLLTVQQSGKMSLTRLKSIRDILTEIEPLLPTATPTAVVEQPNTVQLPATAAPSSLLAATPVTAVETMSAAPAVAAGPVSSQAGSLVMDSQAIEQFLIDFVIERTGYPRELVDVQADLEADLGVDSIAKAQMLGEVREHFALPVRENGRMSLTQLRSIGDLLQAIQQAVGQDTQIAPLAVVAPAAGAQAAAAAVASPHEVVLPNTLSRPSQGLASAAVNAAGTDEPAADHLAAGHPAVEHSSPSWMVPGVTETNAIPVTPASYESGVSFGRKHSRVLQNLAWKFADRALESVGDVAVAAPARAMSAELDEFVRGVADGMSLARESLLAIFHADDEVADQILAAWEEWSSVPRSPLVSPSAHSTEEHLGHGNSQFGSGAVVSGQTVNRPGPTANGQSTHQQSVNGHTAPGQAVNGQAGLNRAPAGPAAHTAKAALATTASNVNTAAGAVVVNTTDSVVSSPNFSVTERFVMQLVPAPLPPIGPGLATEPVFHGAALVVGQNAIAERLTHELQLRGVTVTRIAAPESREQAVELMNELWSHQPTLHVFLTSPYDAAAATNGSWSHWTERRQPGMLATFALLQRWMQLILEHRRVAESSLLCVANLGGSYGFESTVPSIEGGGLAGLLKAILVENWIRGDRLSMVKLVDAPADESLDVLMPAIFRELTLPSLNIEIAIRQGQRYRVGILPEELHVDSTTQVSRGGTWVVTGGARGITAYVIRDLAARFDWTVHLIGTQDIDSAPAEWVERPADQKKQLKLQVMQAARERHEHALNAWERVEKIIEIRKSLAAMRAAGLRVHYHACNVGDQAAVGRTLDRVREISGPIHGVIHGAGVTKDCTIERKDLARVETCCAAKVDGAWALWDQTQRDPLQYFVAFGSIGGRFGANGTSDYSLANDLLAKQVVWFRQARPEVRSVLFHWHAWDEIGMAFRPDVRLGLELFSVNFMPAQEGLTHLRQELQAGLPRPEVLITDRRYFRMFFQEDACEYEGSRSGRLPLIDGPQPYPDMPAPAGSPTAGQEPEVWTATLAPESDPFLVEHRLDDKPLLPVVIAAELCAEAAWASAAKWTRGPAGQPLRVVAFEGLEAAGKLHFHTPDPRDVRVFTRPESGSWSSGGSELASNGRRPAQSLPTADRTLKVVCELKSDVRTRQGQLLETNKLFAKSTMILGEQPLDLGPACDGLPSGRWYPVEYPPRGSRFWVGNSLNWLRAVQFEQGSIWGLLAGQPLNELAGVNREIAGWVVPSALLDACLYGTGLLAWSQVRAGVHLPKKIGRVLLGRQARLGERLVMKSTYRFQTADTATFDFTVYGEDLQPILAVQNYEIVWLPE